MKKLMTVIAMGLMLSFGVAHAADGDKTAQQSKMGTCNKDAGEKKGDERKAFMKECLSAKPAAADGAACDKSAADKKLAGAAKSSHIKKCMADQVAEAKPAAKPAEAAKPVAAAKAAEPAKK